MNRSILIIILMIISGLALSAQNSTTFKAIIINAVDNSNSSSKKITGLDEYFTTEIRRCIAQKRMFDIVADNAKLEALTAKQNLSWQYNKSSIIEYGQQLGAEIAIVPSILQSNIAELKGVKIAGLVGQGGSRITVELNIEVYDISTQQLLTSISFVSSKDDKNLSILSIGNTKNTIDQSNVAKDLLNNLCDDLAATLKSQVDGVIMVDGTLLKGEKLANNGLLSVDVGSTDYINDNCTGILYSVDKNNLRTEIANLTIRQLDEERTVLCINDLKNLKEKKPKLTVQLNIDSILIKIYERNNK